MGGFSVRPGELAAAGASITHAAAESRAAADVVREALSALGAAAAHRGVESAAQTAAARWSGAVRAWALGGDELGVSMIGAAESYQQVDVALMPGGAGA